jgi:hypothetical protein
VGWGRRPTGAASPFLHRCSCRNVPRIVPRPKARNVPSCMLCTAGCREAQKRGIRAEARSPRAHRSAQGHAPFGHLRHKVHQRRPLHTQRDMVPRRRPMALSVGKEYAAVHLALGTLVVDAQGLGEVGAAASGSAASHAGVAQQSRLRHARGQRTHGQPPPHPHIMSPTMEAMGDSPVRAGGGVSLRGGRGNSRRRSGHHRQG